MNERIKKLAEQANAWYPMGYPSPEGGDEAWENLVIFEREDLEKFAQLIVKECARVSLRLSHRDDDMGAIIARNIQGHFGVKE